MSIIRHLKYLPSKNIYFIFTLLLLLLFLYHYVLIFKYSFYYVGLLLTVGSIVYLIVIVNQFNGAIDRLLIQLGQLGEWSYKKLFSVIVFLCLFVCTNSLSIILYFYIFFTWMNPGLLPLASEKEKTTLLFYIISSVILIILY